ncbi:hypothetical protein LXL04_023616 [Taraxacum kok-saghyz]
MPSCYLIHFICCATMTIEDGSGAICVNITTPQFEKIIPMEPIAVEVAQKSWHHRKPTTRYVVINAYKVPQSGFPANAQQNDSSGTRVNKEVAEPKTKPKHNCCPTNQ